MALKTMLLTLLTCLLMLCCSGKDYIAVGEPYTVILNNQVTEWNCVNLNFGNNYHHEDYRRCGRGTRLISSEIDDGEYDWAVTFYNNEPEDGVEFKEGTIIIYNDMTCRVTDDSVYWEITVR